MPDIKHLLDETESNIQLIASGLGNIKIILFCTGAMNWMLDEVKSNKCFIIPKNIGSNKLVVWKKLVSIELALCLLQQLEYLYSDLKQIVESNCFTRYFGAKSLICNLVSSLSIAGNLSRYHKELPHCN